ncbi:PEP-CTERM sorting domain-containing protein [Sphingomonas sp. CL5.1]|uniref:Npun_F0296 family exosortase-dependent surface protein n=1 Tax=Sphingomonas sp. CL5.1 TaxID=2653203 RepID=UPI001581803D|nr:PEPxxWA-CTERM sorting domain-containing protein [Sphingomonas sp. CL5.1]QKR99535.1 PEP-CTERM sorting domain-containing protein [Sphingomonas sp. CL5.1]
MKKIVASVALATTAAFGANVADAALSADFTVKVEAPGVTNTTATDFDYFGVETFDGQSTGVSPSLTTTFGASPITGTYTNVNVIRADQYGGAGGSGNYAVAGINQTSQYSISFSDTGTNGINYFGFWLSALDSGNTVEFFNGGTSLGTFDPTNVLSYVSGNSAYNGNPFSPYQGQNGGQPYVFINFFLDTGTFDRIVFHQTNIGAGYESDNHTVGWSTSQNGGGTVIPGVPEPATWAMMILGFGLVGGVMRTRKNGAKVAFSQA